MTYYNTTKMKGEPLQKAVNMAVTQENRILIMFLKYNRMSASECWKKLFTNEPLTSVRRAITNLTEAGHLRKTTLTTTGHYGKPEYLYEVVSNEPQKTLW